MNDYEIIKQKLINLMNSCGFNISNENMDENLEYDSLQFISTMVDIENEFNIEIPDEFMLSFGLDTANDFLNMILNNIK